MSSRNIAVYICPSSEPHNPKTDVNDDWDIEGPCILSRGNYAGCWGAGIYINKTHPDGTPAPSPFGRLLSKKDRLFRVKTFNPSSFPRVVLTEEKR